VADLLPDYVNGRLGPTEERRVLEHVDGCAKCQEELASWQELGEAVNLAYRGLPGPPEDAMGRVWAKIEMGGARTSGISPSAPQLMLLWQLLLSQIPLVRGKLWAASAITMGLGCVVSLITSANASVAAASFSLFAPVIAAMGIAFVYGPENDPSLEVALSTPTPSRSVLMARLVLVYGYDLALALGATAVLVLTKGGAGLLPLVSLWISPMLFLSALALLVSLFLGPAVAVLTALALWGAKLASAAQLAAPGFGRPSWAEAIEVVWQADAVLLVLAALLLAAAVSCAPYRSRLGRGQVAWGE
jgi:hypothetical protein